MTDHLPAPRHRTVVQRPDGTWAYTDQAPAVPAPQPQVVHVHQAPPDRTLARVALGGGIGAGAVVAGVYMGPLLVGALTAIAADLAVLAVLVAVSGWAVVHVVQAVRTPKPGPDPAPGPGRRTLRRR